MQEAQLPEVVAVLKKYLSDPINRERVTRSRRKRGWEVWLQVDLSLYLDLVYPFYDITREMRVYQDDSLPIDIWAQPGQMRQAGAPQPRSFGIELKVEYDTQTASLRSRLQKDIVACVNGSRALKPALATPGTKLYCIGFTYQLDDCTAGYDTLFRQYPAENMYWFELPRSAGEQGLYYLVWWEHTF